MDSPDLPEPHPGDPWHPAWSGDEADTRDEHAMVRDVEQRLRDLVRGLEADEELRVGLEAAATGRRMLGQIAAVREETPSLLFPDVGKAMPAAADDVAPPEGTAVPESADEPRRRRFGRLRRGASRTRSGAGVDEEEVTDVADERRDDEMQDEGSGDAVQPELGDDEDFPWDDEDWSGARTADDPDTTRELDLVTPTPEPPPSPTTAALAEEAAIESSAVDPVDEASVVEDVAADDEELPEPELAADDEQLPEAEVGSDDEQLPEAEVGADDEELPEAELDTSVEGGAVDPDRVLEDAAADTELSTEDELADDTSGVDDSAVDQPVPAVVAGDERAGAGASADDGSAADGRVAGDGAPGSVPPVMPGEGASPETVLTDTDDESAPVGRATPSETSIGDAQDVDEGASEDDADLEATLEMEAVAGPHEPAVPDEPGPVADPAVADEGARAEPPAVDEDEGIFTHAEVIPLVRAPRIDEEEATAGLDPDLLAVSEDEARNDIDEPGTDEPGTDGDSTDVSVAPEDADAAAELPDVADDFAAFRLEGYTGTATEEYAELARAVAASDEEALELAAISAEMPGLDASLVGLDDVVDAGIGVTETLSTTRRSDLGLRVATALGLLLVFFGSLLWPWAIGGLILVVLGVAALELYIVTVNAGYRPLTWAGLVGVIGALAGTWVWGVVAIPIALALTAIGATLFLALSAERRTPLLDLALTIAMMAWVGVLGAPAFEIVTASEYRWLILAIVLTTAFMDVAQYFVGRALGRRKLAPVVSPKKTIEGLVGGVFAALVVGVVFGSIEASPFDPGSGLVFGAVVAVVAPLGDLAVSVVKRALDVKDMSAILPGHGGIMDRIDAMMFVIPSAWIVFRYLDLLG